MRILGKLPLVDKIFFTYFWLIFIQIINHLTRNTNFNIVFISITIYFLVFTKLYLKSRELALAFYITSFYIVGHFSIISGTSIRSILAIYYFFIILFFLKSGIFTTLKIKFTIVLIFLLSLLFLSGIVGIYFLDDFNGNHTRAYQVITIWSSSIFIAYISINSIRSYIRFSMYLAILSPVFLLSFPLSYLFVLQEYFSSCHPIFLSLGSINRSEIAYTTLLGFVGSLNYFIKKGYASSLFLAFFCAVLIIFCGSKAPLFLMITITLLFVFFVPRFAFIVIPLLLLIIFFLYYNCSFHETYFNTFHSFNTRIDLVHHSVLDFIEKDNKSFISQFIKLFFGSGFGFSTSDLNINGIITQKAASSNFFIDAYTDSGLLGGTISILLFSSVFISIFLFKKYRFFLISIFFCIFIKLSLSSEFYNDVLALVIIGISLRILSKNYNQTKFFRQD